MGNQTRSQGGIENVDQEGGPAKLTISFSTITDNGAGRSSGDGPTNRIGCGIWNNGWASKASSVLAHNTDAYGYWADNHAPDCHSPVLCDFKDFRHKVVGVLNASYSLTDYSSSSTAGIAHGSAQNPLDPGLLARSGSTQVDRVPLASSPALNIGASATDSLFPCPTRT